MAKAKKHEIAPAMHYTVVIALIISLVTTFLLGVLLTETLFGGGLGYFSDVNHEAQVNKQKVQFMESIRQQIETQGASARSYDFQKTKKGGGGGYKCADVDQDGRCIELLSPVEEGVLTANEEYEIRWYQKGIDRVIISYSVPNSPSQSSGYSGTILSEETSIDFEGTRSYRWTVPESLIGSRVGIRVNAYEAGVDQEQSGSYVKVIFPGDEIYLDYQCDSVGEDGNCFEMISPVDGEVLTVGEEYILRYYQKAMDTVSIRYRYPYINYLGDTDYIERDIIYNEHFPLDYVWGGVRIYRWTVPEEVSGKIISIRAWSSNGDAYSQSDPVYDLTVVAP